MITTDRLKSDIVELFELDQNTNIDNSEPLFGDGLGLDSVDAIELSIYLDNTHSITITNLADTQNIFASIDTLVEFINSTGEKSA